jgi:sodium/potassium-transporting ATPase subunit alpha
VWAVTDKSDDDGTAIILGGAEDAFAGATVNMVDPVNDQITSTTFELDKTAFKKGTLLEMVKNAQGVAYCSGKECLLDYHGGFSFRGTVNGKTGTFFNVGSRMMQLRTLMVAQTAYFVAVVEMQWSNVLICKTRYLSLAAQGMYNSVLNFGLMFEFMLCTALAYAGFMHTIFATENMRLVHWFPALPFALFLVALDETRKYVMRSTSRRVIRKDTGRMVRYPGWLETNTYY